MFKLCKYKYVSISGNSRMFSCTGEEVNRLQFNNGGNYTAAVREGSFEIYGDRVTTLGTNMWVWRLLCGFFMYVCVCNLQEEMSSMDCWMSHDSSTLGDDQPK